VKASTAKFTAEELITKRELVREDIKTQLRDRLKPNIDVEEFNIVNFRFSKVFNEAIENKVTAEQQALAARNKLEQIKFEAEQKVAEAKGKAEAITIESNALRSNPQILELRALEKWNGALPQVTGSGGVPFINLPK
jgi:regulator of protease activity HflC (stomatin/prohibitin superfamily)